MTQTPSFDEQFEEFLKKNRTILPDDIHGSIRALSGGDEILFGIIIRESVELKTFYFNLLTSQRVILVEFKDGNLKTQVFLIKFLEYQNFQIRNDEVELTLRFNNNRWITLTAKENTRQIKYYAHLLNRVLPLIISAKNPEQVSKKDELQPEYEELVIQGFQEISEQSSSPTTLQQ